MTRNLLFRNPGFEGEVYRSIVRCSSGTGTTCIDSRASSWPAGFWSGAEFEFIYGHATGRAGIILKSERNSADGGTTLRFADGIAPAAGDFVVLRKIVSGSAETGWWPTISDGGSIQTEFHDLAPKTEGKQALRISSGQGGRAAISSFFDSTPERPFIQLRGTYLLQFKAKSTGGSNLLDVEMSRATSPVPARALLRKIRLTHEWKDYSISLEAHETGFERGAIQIQFIADHSDVLLDEVSFEEHASGEENPSIFRDSVVARSGSSGPGLLRFWAGQLGDSFANQIAPPFSRMRAGFSRWRANADEIQYGLVDFLQLCKSVGAQPYYVVPITFSKDEIQSLIQFLGGANDTQYGKRRLELGERAHQTEEFRRIHLEFGNEAWNPVFEGGTIEDPVAYGTRAGELFQAARLSSGYSVDRFDLVLGGQAVNIPRNQRILSASRAFDSFSVAPYQMDRVDSFETSEQLFQPLFAEPQIVHSDSGYMGRNAALVRDLATPARLIACELNANTMQGSISQDALDSLTPSMGVGLAVIESMLLMLRDLGVREQMLWSLPQYSFKREDGKIAKLFGAVVDIGMTDRKRPQYLAIQLANSVLSGDLLEVRQSGSNPTWDVPGINGVTAKHAHAVQSFALTSGSNRSLILLNLQVAGGLDVTFRGPKSPRGDVRMRRLHAPSITANNETENDVSITERSMQTFDPASEFFLPPYSMTVLTWKGDSQ